MTRFINSGKNHFSDNSFHFSENLTINGVKLRFVKHQNLSKKWLKIDKNGANFAAFFRFVREIFNEILLNKEI